MKPENSSCDNLEKISEKVKICEGKVTLTYSLFKENIYEREAYSLLIEESGVINDRIFIEDLTDSYDAASEILKLFVTEEVTPCSAFYILDDILPI